MNEGQRVLYFREEQPQRLDKFLAVNLPEFSRSRLQKLIKDGLVVIDGIPAYKSGQVLDSQTVVQVTVPPAPPSAILPEDIPLHVVFENQDLMVVNKPAGMVVHPAAGHARGTLVHAALAHSPEMEGVGGEQRPGVVHRLDKNTSGLILLAKNDEAHRWLQDQFRNREVEKVYLTLVDGRPPTPTGRVETPIGRSSAQRKMMAIVPEHKGRKAISEYHEIEVFPEHSLLEVRPLTGRTHQIRLHMKFLGCPVTGDTVYGHSKPTLPLRRHFLHAARLAIKLPGETGLRTFEADIPSELADLLEMLRRGL